MMVRVSTPSAYICRARCAASGISAILGSPNKKRAGEARFGIFDFAAVYCAGFFL
jgi:hypothetical protein